jgi:hypothetical protein
MVEFYARDDSPATDIEGQLPFDASRATQPTNTRNGRSESDRARESRRVAEHETSVTPYAPCFRET